LHCSAWRGDVSSLTVPHPPQVTGRLDRPTFHTVLMKHAPGLTEDGIIDRVHEVVDMDKDGFINFQELCFGLSTVMRGSLNDKLTMLFDIYDYNGDHEISIVELVSLIRKNDADFMQMIEFAEEVVASLDKNGDDEISRYVFLCLRAHFFAPTLTRVGTSNCNGVPGRSLRRL